MAMSISLNTKTSTSITVDTAGRTTGTYDRIEWQISTRPDFSFTLSPIADLATSASQLLQSLNQGNVYYVRAREKVAASGVVTVWSNVLKVYLALANTWDTSPLSILLRPAIIVVPEDVTWNAVGVQTSRPADNLGTDSPAEQCWFASGPLKFDTAGQPIDTIALLGTNLPIGVNWRAESFATAANRDAGTSVVSTTGDVQFHASPNLPGRPWYNGLLRLAAPRTELYWRLVFTAATGALPPASTICAMFGVVGLARTAKSIAADKVEQPLDYGNIDRQRDGVPDRRYGWRGRRVDFQIALMTEAQWETQFADLRNRVGFTDPVLVLPNTRTGSFLHDRLLYGPLTAHRATQPYSPRFTHDFTIDSLI